VSTEGVLDTTASEDGRRARAGERDKRENRAGDSDKEADDGEEDEVAGRVGMGVMEEGLFCLFRLGVMVVDGGTSRHFRRRRRRWRWRGERERERQQVKGLDLRRENIGEAYNVKDREYKSGRVECRVRLHSFTLLCSPITDCRFSVVVPAQVRLTDAELFFFGENFLLGLASKQNLILGALINPTRMALLLLITK